MQNSDIHPPREPQPIAEQDFYLKQPQYWAYDAISILDDAKKLADDIISKTENAKLPEWVALMSDDNIKELKNKARVFDNTVIGYSEAIFNGQLIENKKDLTSSTEQWYRRLGPTNENEDLKDVFIKALSHLELEPDTPRRNLLMGNLLQDLALRESNPEESAKYLASALDTYNKNLEKYKNINDKDIWATIRHSIDCEHQFVRMLFEKGKTDKEWFDNNFKRLQINSIQEVGNALKNGGKEFGIGELFEWVLPIFARHTHFNNSEAEKFDVRSGLIREDKAIYPWQLEFGQGPLWSSDTIIKSVDKPNSVERIQLKSGKFNLYSGQNRLYLPNAVRLVVASEVRETTLWNGIVGYLKKIKNEYDLITNPSILKVNVDESTSQVMDFIDDVFKKAS